MNESDYNQLMEKSWRGELTASQKAELQAWLAQHPEREEDWNAEMNLTEAMKRLPEIPVSSNFTARVLRAVEHEGAAKSPPRLPAWKWLLHSFIPRAAFAAVVLAGLFTYHEYRTAERRAELVHGVEVIAGVPSLPSPEILQNFDTIRKMGATPGPDPELIALMK